MALTYAQLGTVIEETTENSETTFVSNIPGFVRQAEQRIYLDAQIPPTRKLASMVCSVGSPYVALPSGFLSPLSLAVVQAGSHTFLLNKDVSFMREAYPSEGATAVPQFYAVFNEAQYIVAPTPDVAYALEARYMGFPASIVDTGTSWLGNNFETVLLYGSLINAYVFMKGEADVLKMYEDRYVEALGQLKALGASVQKDAYR
jgi:hypothetical protein